MQEHDNFHPKSKMKRFFLVLLTICTAAAAMAQGIRVTGTVTSSEDGLPVSGVTVMIEGTSIGTTTGEDGSYAITLRSDSDALVFACLGFSDVKVKPAGKSLIDVTISPDTTMLDELVVIGYGTVRKSDLTGAVSSVKGDELKKASVASVGAALQGKVAGVTVTSNTGQPGTDVAIRIRGIGSVNAGVSPLYVVDGMIVSDIGFLSPNDIETTEVLKDAASAAIYGSRAANGVILITTKSASKAEKASITFETYAGVQTRWKKLSLMNSADHIATYFKLNNPSSGELGAYQEGGLNGWLNYARIGGVSDFALAGTGDGQFDYGSQNTDWQDEVFRSAAIQNYYIAIDSGSRKVSQTFSANYFSQDGTIIGSWYKRLNLHYNATSQIKDWLKFGSSLNFSSTKSRWSLNNNSQPGASVISAAMAMAPWDPVRYPAGTKNSNGEDMGGKIAAASNFKNVVNPLSMAEHSHPRGSGERFVGQIFADINIVKGLVFHSDFNADISYNHSRSFTEKYYHSNADKMDKNMISQNMNRYSTLSFNNYATWTKSFGKHNLSVMGGQTIEISKNEGVGVGGATLLHSDERFWSLNYATTDFTYGGSFYGPYRRMSFIGRVNYDYANRYLLTFNWRSDGNRSFQNHPWGHFPSVAAAWKISEEPWLKDAGKISLLKVRLGWGMLGNDNVDSNLFTMVMDSSMYANLGYPFGPNTFDQQALNTGAAVTSIKNLDGKWEISEHYNFGIDFGFLQDRLTGTVDMFIRDTRDLLLARRWPYYVGALYTAVDNIGTMRNSGIELSLGWRDSFKLAGKDFFYDVNGNISFVKNRITNMNGADPVYGDKTITDQGYAVGSFWGYKADGIFRSQEEIDSYFKTSGTGEKNIHGFEVGDVRYKDLDKDGELDDINDMTVIGNPFPKFTYGINVSLGWGPLDMSMFFQGVYGNKVYNALRERLEGNGLNAQLSTRMKDVWTTDNMEGSLPNPNHTVNFWASDRFLEDASYLRLKTMQIGYTFPRRLTEKLKIQNLRLYVSANNLLTITGYSGYDPEVGGGVDYGNYPQSRTFMAGINLKF